MNKPIRNNVAIPAALALFPLPVVYFGLGAADIARGGYGALDSPSRVQWTAALGFLVILAIVFAIGGGRRAMGSPALKRLWFGLMPVMWLLTAVELGSGAYQRIKYPVQETYSFGRLDSPLYAGSDWARDVIEASLEISYVYAPFRLWRATPIETPWFNVDAEGTRGSVQPEPRPGGRPLRVQVHGGSTVFCLEVSDEHTLPSRLGAALAERLPGREVTVENLGVPSYIRAQQAIWMREKLRNGPKPDLIVFYDGANDFVFSGWMQLAHKHFDSFAEAMRGDDVRLRTMAGALFFSYTHVGRLFALRRAIPLPEKDSFTDEQLRLRAGELAERYVAIAREVRQMAEAEGIATAFVLQPMLYGKPSPTKAEKVFLDYDYFIRPAIERFYPMFVEAVLELEDGSSDFIDLSAHFDDRADDVYFDVFHVGPRENDSLGFAIAESLVERLVLD